MPAAGVVLLIAVLLIIVALVYYLVSTIVALQKITKGLDDAIAGVGGIIQKTEPVNEVVGTINANLGAAAEGFRNFPESKTTKAPRISEVRLPRSAGRSRRRKPKRRSSASARAPSCSPARQRSPPRPASRSPTSEGRRSTSATSPGSWSSGC